MRVLIIEDDKILSKTIEQCISFKYDVDRAFDGEEGLAYAEQKIYDAIKKENGILIVTADHGNCEEMLDSKGNIITSHTTNLVPFIVTEDNITLKSGSLCDIAPTILELMDLPIPKEMTGKSLIIK